MDFEMHLFGTRASTDARAQLLDALGGLADHDRIRDLVFELGHACFEAGQEVAARGLPTSRHLARRRRRAS